jgi:tetratricopeptide (TPR) repeat protein
MAFPTPTDDSLRLPSDDRASNAIFIGRTDEINRFQSYLDQWKTHIVTASFAANPQENALPGRDNKIQGLVVLLYGRGGFGKSTLLKHYCEIATQPSRNLTACTIIDWQSVVMGNRDMFNPPPGQTIDAEAYFTALRDQLGKKLGKSADKFKEFNKAVNAVQNARKQINGELDQARKDQRHEWLLKASSQEIVALVRAAFPVVNAVPGIDIVAGATQQGIELGAKYGMDQVDALYTRLRDKLRHETALEYLTPELKLGVSLGKDLAQFAKDFPLLIFIDTYELADEGDPFLRIVMGAAGGRVGWVIAGRDNLWAGKDFYMRSPKNVIGYKEIVDFGFAVDFNAGGVGAFTIADIIDYFTLLCKIVPHLPATITEAEAGRILDITEGVPLAVQIAAGIYLETGDLNIVTQKDGRKQEIIERMVQRYLQHVQDDPDDRDKLYGLALLRRSDTHQVAAIAVALGLSGEQGNKGSYDDELRRLHRRYSFIFSEKTQNLLHKEVRDFLRQSLLERRNDPDIQKINQRLWDAHKTSLMLLEERRQYSDLRERLEETEWVGAYLDLVEQQFWLEPSDGVNSCLPFMLAEAIYGRNTNQERPYANPEAVAVGNFFSRELQYPYNNRWAWAASSLVYLKSDNPLPEALHGLEELERLISQRCPTFLLPLPDYRPKLTAALWWRLGEAYASDDNYKSWAWYKKALNELSDEKELCEAAAWISWNIGFKLLNDDKKYSESLPYINRSLELNPDNVYAYNGRGVVYKNLKDYDHAFSDYNQAIELDSDYANVYNNRGNVYYILKQYDAAIKDYNEAIDHDHTFAIAYNNRGNLYFDRKEYNLALQEYNKTLELDPRYTDAYNNRGRVYAARNEYDLALQEYNKTLELDPRYIYAYNNRGLVYAARKEYNLALQEYNKALELDPRYTDAYNNRGNLYFDRKEYNLALQEYNKALELDPRYTDAYAYRAQVSLWLKNVSQAANDFRQCFEYNSGDINVAWMDEWARMNRDRPDGETAKRLEQISTIDPEHYIAHVSRGVACGLRGKVKEGLIEVEKAIPLAPKEWDAYFWKGLLAAYYYRGKTLNTTPKDVIEQSLDVGLPPILLAPLYWLEKDAPEIFEKQMKPLLLQYNI